MNSHLPPITTMSANENICRFFNPMNKDSPSRTSCKTRYQPPPVSTLSTQSSTWILMLLEKSPFPIMNATGFCHSGSFKLEIHKRPKHLYSDPLRVKSFKSKPANGKTLCCQLPFYSFLSSCPATSSPPLNASTHPTILPFSSGTTGPPKGVMVSHRNLITQTLSHVGDGEYYYRAFANFQDTTLVGNNDANIEKKNSL